jgi:acetyltransferase-like isoleucine patch superfamily enzyme
MNWYEPKTITLPADPNLFLRMITMLGHYDTRWYVNENAWIDVGAGSLPYIECLTQIPGTVTGYLGSIGRFVEMHATAKILVHGDHDNGRPVNITFASMPTFTRENGDKALARQMPFSIGNGVVLSAGVHVLSGRSIGDGAVLGAGSIVTKDVPSFEIWAGSPAKKINARPSCPPWWDFEPAYILNNQARLNDVVLSGSNHPYRQERPRFAYFLAGGTVNLRGIVDGGKLLPFEAAPEKVRSYILQSLQAPEPVWLADCWAS